MESEEYQNLLLEAVNTFGLPSQILIWIEEMAELTQSLCKYDRKINPSSYQQVCEEIADVDICLDQMKLLFLHYEEFKIQKVKRLKGMVLQ